MVVVVVVVAATRSPVVGGESCCSAAGEQESNNSARRAIGIPKRAVMGRLRMMSGYAGTAYMRPTVGLASDGTFIHSSLRLGEVAEPETRRLQYAHALGLSNDHPEGVVSRG